MMKKGTMIAAAALMTVGLVIFWGAMLGSRFEIPAWDFDFSIFALVSDSDGLETHSSRFDSDFSNLEIDAEAADITIAPYDGTDVKVQSGYGKNDSLSIETENDTMKIVAKRGRRGNGFFSFFSRSFSVTVYLPSKAYNNLTIATTEGDIRVGEGLTVSSSDITTRTGDVRFGASVDGSLEINSTTGDIRLSDVKAGETYLTVTTGDVTAERIVCAGLVTIKVQTGDTRISDMTCGELLTLGSTGDVRLKDTVASGRLAVSRSTGDVRLLNCDGGELVLKTSTGDVKGTLRTGKNFITRTSFGSVNVPESSDGGDCKITTSVGDIDISVK